MSTPENQQVATTTNNAPAAKPADPRSEALRLLRKGFEDNRAEITKVLPPQIPFERFKRVVDTAVMRNPDLLIVPPRELFMACMQAATDGLLPDNKESALVIFNMKDGKDGGGKDRWRKAVQYMPMISGILKKARNSGELLSIVAKVVYGGDTFRNWIDDDGEHITYEAGVEQDRDIIRGAFAMAKLKDGAIEVEYLTPKDIEKIRSVSRSKDKGPWVEWWEEMAKKSAIRRLSKRLPMSTDLDDLIRRDDALYDLEGARDDRAPAALPTATVQGLGTKLDLIAGAPDSKLIDHDPDTGEIIEEQQADTKAIEEQKTNAAPQTTPQTRPSGAANKPDAEVQDRRRPAEQASTGKPDAAIEQRAAPETDAPGEDARQVPVNEPANKDGDPGAYPEDQSERASAPTAQDRERMEYEAELLSIAQTKAQKGERPLKLWLGSLEDSQLEVLKRLEKQIAAYLPPDQKVSWPKR